MGNFSKFPTCPFSMLLSDSSQINLGDSTIKCSTLRVVVDNNYQDVTIGH